VSTIIRMTRYGRLWKIELDCGHVIERHQDDIKKQQLYVDKRIGCERCEQLNPQEEN
jgi:hypothetical protein